MAHPIARTACGGDSGPIHHLAHGEVWEDCTKCATRLPAGRHRQREEVSTSADAN